MTLPRVPPSAKALIAADTKYWLWINGQQVVFEGGLRRGPANDSYVDEVEIAPFLTAGNNTVAVLVWYFGQNFGSYVTSGKGGLFFEADAGGTAIVSDGTWKVKLYQGPPTISGFREPYKNIEYDGRNDLGDWTAAGFSDGSWTGATPKGTPPAASWGRLWPRNIPQWRNSGIVHYLNQEALPKTGTGDVIHAQLPSNVQVTPYLRIGALRPARITVRTDRSGNEQGTTAHYITRAGEQAYECLGWMSGHEVQYTIPDGIRILNLGYRETAYNADLAGSFKCNDDALDTLWTKAARTLLVNMRDTYMDCPTRERNLWWGDAVNEIGETAYALDRRADLLTRNAIITLMEWQNPDGVLHSPVPGRSAELPLQMLASVGVESLWSYYMQSGDLEAMKYAYPHVKAYLSVWKRDARGWSWAARRAPLAELGRLGQTPDRYAPVEQ